MGQSIGVPSWYAVMEVVGKINASYMSSPGEAYSAPLTLKRWIHLVRRLLRSGVLRDRGERL